MNFNFIPFTAVGEFLLNSIICKYQPSYDFEYVENFAPETCGSPDRYDLEEFGLSFWVVDALIENIKCYKYLIYKGKNLIYMGMEEFMEHTGERYYGEVDILDFEDDGLPQSVYEFEDIGAQVWVKNGKIVTIIVYGR